VVINLCLRPGPLNITFFNGESAASLCLLFFFTPFSSTALQGAIFLIFLIFFLKRKKMKFKKKAGDAATLGE
jgi:hypothetical protein